MSYDKKLLEAIKNGLSETLLRDLNITEDGVEQLVELQRQKHEIFRKMRKASIIEEHDLLRIYAAEVLELDYAIQETYGFSRDSNYFKPWELPGCSCNVFSNIELFATGNYVYNKSCPIHRDKKKNS